MSEEAAFLDALKANPADDTTRLVYADWLDEHGEPLRAEYLRLVVAFTRSENDLITSAGSFLGLAVALAKDWRSAVGSRFALVLDDCTDVVKTCKWIRELTGLGIGEARYAIWRAPYILLNQTLFEDAFAIYERVRNWDYFKLRITPSDTP